LSDEDVGVVLEGGEADGFITGREASEVWNLESSVAGVLVCDEGDGFAVAHELWHGAHGAELVEEVEASAGAGLADPFVCGAEVEGSVDGVHVEAEEGHGVADDFPVATVSC